MLKTPVWVRVFSSYASNHPLWHEPNPINNDPFANSNDARCRQDVVRVTMPFTESWFVPGTDAVICTGLPDCSAPVVMLSACNSNVSLPPSAGVCIDTTYIMFEVASMTGVEVTPSTGCMGPFGIALWPVCRSDTCQRGVPGPYVSASKAYMLSFSVATNTTSCVPPLIVKPETSNGCAYTYPSTG